MRGRDLSPDAPPELSPESIGHQAGAFWAFYRRAGLPLSEAFDRWSSSKGFNPGDLEAVRAEVFEP
jgi:hypothetical protein